MENWLEEPKAAPVLTGNKKAILRNIAKVMADEWVDGVKTGNQIPKTLFEFEIPSLVNDKGQPRRISCRKSVSIHWEKSGLMIFLLGACPDLFPKRICERNKKEIFDRMFSMIGYEFMLSLGPTKDGKYTEIKTAILMTPDDVNVADGQKLVARGGPNQPTGFESHPDNAGQVDFGSDPKEDDVPY